MTRAVIITGGGMGLRMGSAVPKQFIEIKGKPLIVHTIGVFLNYDWNMMIVVVLPLEYFELWENMKREYFPDKEIYLTSGGKTRFDSVKNGLKLLNGEMIIGIHDAVRPLVSPDVISECFKLAQEKGSAVPVISLNESVRKTDGKKNYPVFREGLKIIQTPQVFKGDLLINAYKRNFKDEFTDDATVVEKSGVTVYLTEGNPENIKITTPYDMKLADFLLGNN